MVQACAYDIQKEIQNILADKEKQIIHISIDWRLTTIGNLQIKNLDWRWVSSDLTVDQVLKYDPFDWMFRYNIKGGHFNVVKYGLSVNPSWESYSPSWKLGTPYEKQQSILMEEMKQTYKNGGAKVGANEISVDPKSDSWITVDRLAKKCSAQFMRQQNDIIDHNKKNKITYNDEELWKSGAKATFEILRYMEMIEKQIAR